MPKVACYRVIKQRRDVLKRDIRKENVYEKAIMRAIGCYLVTALHSPRLRRNG